MRSSGQLGQASSQQPTMGKDDDDIPPAAGLGESHIPPFGSWQPLEFELGFPVEEWGTIGFDDLDFNLPDHLIQGETIHVSESHHQSAVAASSPVTTLDYELANATQPTDELVLARNVNTQSPNGETEEPPDLAGLARHIRPEQSRRSATVQSRPDLGISCENSISGGTQSQEPCFYPHNLLTLSRHGSENISRHPTSHRFPSSTGGMESLAAPRSENEFYTNNSLSSFDPRTSVGTHDFSEQWLRVSPWAGLRGTALTDVQWGVQAPTDESHSFFLFVSAEQASMPPPYTDSQPVPAPTARDPSLFPPAYSSPSLNQSPLGMSLDPGTYDRHQARRERDRNDAERHTQTRKVRKLGACLRCRIYKEKCDLETPCERCVQVTRSAKLFKQPCQRFDLTDVIPFRTGNARMGQRNSIFPEPSWLAESTTRTSFITYYFEGVDVNLLPTLKLSCLEFDPTKDAVLSEHYKDVDGNVMVVKSPCVACIDIATPMIRQALEEYMRQICPIAIQEILNTSKDEIYRQGLAEANRLAYASYNPIPMLQKALEILACVHINFDTPILVGDTLGVPILKDKRSPIHGRYPVPSVLDFQLDTLCIHHMQKLMKAVSRSLKKLIFSSERQSRWYEIFLTIFVLLVSIEQVYLTQCEYLRGATIVNDGVNIFAQASPVTSHMLSMWRASAKYLLYHYRCVMKGTLPFSPSFKLEGAGNALPDADARQYIRKTAALVREREAELNAVRDTDFDNTLVQPLSWISELFLD